MQMVGISKNNVSKGMLSSLSKEAGSKNTSLFEKETIDRVLKNKNIQKTMELLSKV